MSYIKYNNYKTNEPDALIATKALLRNISLGEFPVRLIFFTEITNNEQYSIAKEQIEQTVKNWFVTTNEQPMVALVSQAPTDCLFAVEVQSISKKYMTNITIKKVQGVSYATIDVDNNKMVISGAIEHDDKNLTIAQQSEYVFAVMADILKDEKIDLNMVDRQWNYLENITAQCQKAGQHYQQLNDVRSQFYATTKWANGYPSATGIGTTAGGIMVQFDAATLNSARTVSLDNSLQVAAHQYSKQVLIGEQNCSTTPKFERAKAIVFSTIFGDTNTQIYISGTAAIRGENSLHNVDIKEQTAATLENIEYLISLENLKKHNIKVPKAPKVKIFRVYLKSEALYKDAHEIISRKFPAIPTLYVVCDVCRDELLIEIEGIAE